MATSTKSKFDYTKLDPKARAMAQRHAQAIHQHLRRSSIDVISVGRRLIMVREHLGAGPFRQWLEQDFEWSAALASNHMRAAARFGDLDCIGQFQPSALYVLSRRRVDKRAVARAIALAKRGRRITQRLAQQLIAQYERPEKKQPPATSLRQLQRVLDQASQQTAQLVNQGDPAELRKVAQQLEQLAKTLRGGAKAPQRTAPRTSAATAGGKSPAPSKAQVPPATGKSKPSASRSTNGQRSPSQAFSPPARAPNGRQRRQESLGGRAQEFTR